MSGIYQRKTNSATAKNPNSNQTLISVDETGKIFTKDSSGNVTVYPTTGGGGSFTGGTVTGEAIFTNGLSANTMSSSTLNVNYSDAFTFGVDENVSQSITEYIDDFGGWTTLPFTGTVIGGKLDFANNEIYDAIQVGNASIPGIPAPPIPGAISGQLIKVNDGILSGSTSRVGINLFDQTGLGGDVSIQNGFNTVINNTLSGSNISYAVDTSFNQNEEFSSLIFGKTNEAGEIIELNFNSDATGLNLFSELTDVDAEIFRIVDTSGDYVNLFSISKGGPDVISDSFGFKVLQPSSAYTQYLLYAQDDEFNTLFSVNAHNSGSFNSQVDIPHNGKSDVIFRILSSDYSINHLQVDANGSTTFYSALSGLSKSIFSVENGSRIAFGINDTDSTFLNDINLYLSNSLPTSPVGLSAGQVYTQTAAELGGSGSTKVLCIV
jgi:hypothetical protein